jgi:hypothetical protein
MADLAEVLRLVNAAREVYGCAPLVAIPRGERASPSFDPMARAFRAGADDWLFLAIGSNWLRLGACGKDVAALAARIHCAWYGGDQPISRRAAEGGSFYVKLPQPIVDFIAEFDAGKLREFETRVADHEHARHAEVVKSCGEIDRFIRMKARKPHARASRPADASSSAA